MGIFDSFLSTSETLTAFSDGNFVDAMLRFEAALANAQAAEGLIPDAAARSIVGSCKVELFDVAKIVRDSGRAGSIAMPLVRSLKDAVGMFNPQAVPYVHFGSCSQDVIDSAMALVTRDALRLVEADLVKAACALLGHAERHAATPILARTLMQPASVTGFGLKCVGWAAPLVRSRDRLSAVAVHALKLQLGGAVGTLAGMKGRGDAVRRRMAEALGLGDPGGAWHTQRDEWVALGCELGLLVGSLGKIAKDIALLSQHEVGEVASPCEAGPNGSPAMARRRNPAAAMVSIAAAQRVPQHVAALLAAMPQEHERALGAWQAELAEWPQLLISAHGSVRAMAGALSGLEVDAARMRANIERVRAEAAVAVSAGADDDRFDPALAEPLAPQVSAQVRALRIRLDARDPSR